MKKHIREFSLGLDELIKINPVLYQYNEKSGYDMEKEHIGLIAQELLPIAPFMVETYQKHGKEYYAVDASPLVYMLVNAIKELQRELDLIKEELNK